MTSIPRLGLAGTGALLMWSGVRGASITGSLRDVVTGVPPQSGQLPISGASAQDISDDSGTGDAVSLALQYVGTPYVSGQSNPPAAADCSGLVNAIYGHHLKKNLPGIRRGSYSGHGPVTQQWKVWNGLETVPNSEMQAGDLVCWWTHMGIVVAQGTMVSALNPFYGTKKTPIQGWGPTGESYIIRRYK